MTGTKYEAMMVESDGGLIPSLPDDVARLCLLRVPPYSHAQLPLVSPKWRELVNSPQFYEERKREGTSEKLVAMVQAIEPPSIVTGKPTGAQKQSPVFGISVLNVRRRTWERLPCIPDFPESLPIFCRVVAVDGKLIVLGGWHPTTYETLQTVYIFNFVTQSWSRGAPMPTPRSFFACAATDHNRVFIAGGHDNSKTALTSAALYDVDADAWSTLPPMREERDESTGLCIDGAFYVISGYLSNSQGQFMETGEVFNPSTNSWTVLESMWNDASRPPGPFAVMLGKLYLLREQNLLCYNAETGAWSLVERVPDEDVNVVSLAAVDEALLVTGPSRNMEELGFETFVYKPRRKGAWESLGRQAGFAGMAQSSISMEI